MKSIRSIISKAGDYPVRQVSVHHSSERVDLSLPRSACLHTTEGGFSGSYDILSRRYSPHFMLGFNPKAKRAEIIQFVPVGYMGTTTRAHNNLLLVQIEMVGYSKEKPWLPEGKDPDNGHYYGDTLDALASLMNVCETEWGIPRSHPWKDGDFGLAGLAPRNKHRSQGKLGHIAGWYGHGDMPNPDVHWDPGNLKWSKVFDRAHELQDAHSVPAPITNPALIS